MVVQLIALRLLELQGAVICCVRYKLFVFKAFEVSIGLRMLESLRSVAKRS